jgi:hypothetical protein
METWTLFLDAPLPLDLGFFEFVHNAGLMARGCWVP